MAQQPLTPDPSDEDHPWEGLGWYAQRKPVFTGANELQLLKGGQALFAALCTHIEQARHTIWMAMYLISPHGESGSVLLALQQAAQRGVKVLLVADGVGSHDAPKSMWDQLRAAGVEVAIHRPFHKFWGVIQTSEWRRMHLKLCVVDEKVSFIGGINLIDDRYDLHHGWSDTARLDYAVQIKGPACTPVLHTVKAMWTRAQVGKDWRDELWPWMQDAHRMRRLRGLWQQARMRLTPAEQAPFIKAASNPRPTRCAFVLRDNLRQRRTIERAAIQAIKQARREVDIVTPYFYPGRQLRLSLRHAAARGVKVRLLLQGKVDLPIAGLAARVLYDELILHGIQIHEYQPAFLHAKVMRVDDDWATIGSSNLDPLSLVLNMEANLIVRDKAFVKTVKLALAEDFAASKPVLSDQTQGSWADRLGHWLFRVSAKLYLRLAGITGRY
ncbi:MAG: cardiolipin synthase ClsB [Burkholderiales bacterium]|nr:cardiolipin synthase ClsB [Burkholderiales bacterium]